ncbi:hypothetical protein LQ757_06025 [Agromyces sp. SYSU K20354]|uniref:hypothetical protein n=1 Tax=Agromyces cavernae TaxID=2898659 RepID=UPI001E4449CA|nr:hypothetical protein [Agromyces cavernae]MCD2441834.1 hypothetical protein [Agromyces cavernae]
MDWTFWVVLIVIAGALVVTQWLRTLRRRRDTMRGENREVADAADAQRKAKEQAKHQQNGPFGGGIA